MLPTLWDILESINPHKNHLKNCCSLDCVKKAILVRRTKHLWSKFSYQTNYSSSHQMSTLITISKDLAPTRPVQGIAPWRSCVNAALLIDMKGSSIKKMVTTVRMIRVKTIGNVGRYTIIFHLYFGHLLGHLPTAESVSPKTQLPHQGCCIFILLLLFSMPSLWCWSPTEKACLRVNSSEIRRIFQL